MDVWLPEGYSKNKQYPVFYMHDGQNLFDTTTAFMGNEWGVDKTLSSLTETAAHSNAVFTKGIIPLQGRRSGYAPKTSVTLKVAVIFFILIVQAYFRAPVSLLPGGITFILPAGAGLRGFLLLSCFFFLT